MTATMHAEHVTNCGRIDRYREVLRHIPPPGCGCHTSLLGVANHGTHCRKTTTRDIRRHSTKYPARITANLRPGDTGSHKQGSRRPQWRNPSRRDQDRCRLSKTARLHCNGLSTRGGILMRPMYGRHHQFAYWTSPITIRRFFSRPSMSQKTLSGLATVTRPVSLAIRSEPVMNGSPITGTAEQGAPISSSTH